MGMALILTATGELTGAKERKTIRHTRRMLASTNSANQSHSCSGKLCTAFTHMSGSTYTQVCYIILEFDVISFPTLTYYCSVQAMLDTCA